MTKREAGTYHIQIAIHYPKRMHEAGTDITGWLEHEGQPCTADEIVEYCDKLAAMGYEVIPCCDNTDDKGRCLGCDES